MDAISVTVHEYAAVTLTSRLFADNIDAPAGRVLGHVIKRPRVTAEVSHRADGVVPGVHLYLGVGQHGGDITGDHLADAVSAAELVISAVLVGRAS